MALSDIPAIKPSMGTVFLMGAFLAVFIFFFTQDKIEPRVRNQKNLEAQ